MFPKFLRKFRRCFTKLLRKFERHFFNVYGFRKDFVSTKDVGFHFLIRKKFEDLSYRFLRNGEKIFVECRPSQSPPNLFFR